MTVELNAEYESRAQKLVAAGRFRDMEEVLQAGVDALEENESWLCYARERIQRGLNDIEAGRTVSGEAFMEQLHRARLKHS